MEREKEKEKIKKKNCCLQNVPHHNTPTEMKLGLLLMLHSHNVLCWNRQ